MNHYLTPGAILDSEGIWTADQTLADDVTLIFGNDGDAGVRLVSGGLSADEEVTNLIVGTSNHQGVAANSLVNSVVAEDGDWILLVNDGGNSKEAIRVRAASADLDLGHGMALVNFRAQLRSQNSQLHMLGNSMLGVPQIFASGADTGLQLYGSQNLSGGAGYPIVLHTLDATGNAWVVVAEAVPTATETTPFWAQRADITTPLSGTLQASFLTFQWDPSDDTVAVFVNDGGTIRSVDIGTVT